MAMNRMEKPSKIGKICVYCGSGPGTDPAFVAAARAFGEILAKNGIGLVYGGGAIGIMGAIARSVHEHGGEVTGIIPKFLMARERALHGTHELIVTHDLHERKRKMFEMADAFVALPGGVGTLEEIVEQMTWAQLGRHKKPILVANIAEFWSPFLNLLQHMKEEAFIRTGLDVRFAVVTDAKEIVPAVIEAVGERRAIEPASAALTKL